MTNFAGANFGTGVPPGYGYGTGYGPPQQYGYGAPYGYTAPVPVPDPERFSPAAQTGISALLLVPTILILFLQSLLRQATWVKEWPEPLRNVWDLGCNALLWLYFLVVVAFWARRNRRVAAVSIVVAMALFDTALVAAYLWYPSLHALTGDSRVLMWVLDACPVLIAVGQAAAWGVARRRNKIWAVGLIVTVVLATVDQAVRLSLIRDAVRNRDSFTEWWNQWWGVAATSLGIFVLSCLICWAMDAMSSGARRTTTPQFGGR
ncbi:hypothetical protein [Mycolicibacterium sp. HK-90]|uniref:hypothetical protein n=1 Tax=Mycolicibacterium sp. HK-90 TaxID=3056937 RepID=UPI00265AD724|nr:hypothetical protein [Mycolicibacterium sp. HK-90]WKG05643.1 hypothetical protein QU592_11430 [Mycolicibacterium sp. HK-90]